MASLFKRGDTYWLQWYEDGIRKRKSLKTTDKGKAETICNAKEIQIRTGVNVFNRADGTSFKVFKDRYLDWHEQEYPDSHQRVRQIVLDHLADRVGDLGLNQITPDVAERYKQTRRAVVAVETVNKELRTLHAVINKAVEWNVIHKNQIKGVKAIRNTESAPNNYYTASQLGSIYAADASYANTWKLLANTGLRRAEALALKWDNVLDDRIRVVSTGMSRTKSRKWRDIPISPGCCDALNMLLKSSTDDYVLPHVHKASLSRAFHRVLEDSGNIGSLHDLRHTFISHLVMKGVPLRTVQVLAGHASFRTTEGYAHLAPDHLKDSVSGLSI